MATPYEIGAAFAVKTATEKEAFWGILGRAATKAPQIAKGFGQVMRAGGGFMKSVAEPMAKTIGENWSGGLKTISNAYANGGVRAGLGAAARSPLAKEMAMGAVMNGGMNALMAEKGDKMNAFGRGAAWGAAGGAAFKGMHAGMSAFNKTAPMEAFRSQKGIGGFFKRNLTRPGLVAGAAGMAMPTGAKENPINMGGVAGQVVEPGLPMSNIPGFG